jgi:hypothetical protein
MLVAVLMFGAWGGLAQAQTEAGTEAGAEPAQPQGKKTKKGKKTGLKTAKKTPKKTGLKTPKKTGLKTAKTPGLKTPKKTGLKTAKTPGLKTPKKTGLKTAKTPGLKTGKKRVKPPPVEEPDVEPESPPDTGSPDDASDPEDSEAEDEADSGPVADTTPQPPPAQPGSGEVALPPGLSSSSPGSPSGGNDVALPPGLSSSSPGSSSGGNDVALPAGLDNSSPSGGGEIALPAGLGDGEADDDAGDDADLPAGLGDDAGDSSSGGEDLALIPGLEGSTSGGGLPTGGEDDTLSEEEEEQEQASLLEQLGLSGFVDLRNGVRVQDDPHESKTVLSEVRLQLSMEQDFLDAIIKITSDFLLDQVESGDKVDLRYGQGPIDLREASLAFTPLDFLDVKIGRQALTWGTADFIFLNDLFPKDFEAFFTGRDTPYLKAPSDAVKTSWFTPVGNLDFIFVPRFNPDRFITGRRLSYYNGNLGQLAGQNAIVQVVPRTEWGRDNEMHARLSLNVGSAELAAYGYRGYWKSPGGFDPEAGKATFPRLNVFGASFRNGFFGGIASAEAAYYHSLGDKTGDNPLISNSEARLVVGYERQLPAIAADLNFWAQYYVEYLPHYAAYLSTLPEGAPARDEFRHLATLRVSKLLLRQTMRASVLAVYSPSDKDGYVNPSVSYKVADCCSLAVGGNFFFGTVDYTFLSQLQNNSNAYAALQYGF